MTERFCDDEAREYARSMLQWWTDRREEYSEPNGFVHTRCVEWVDRPMYACTCGVAWPCSFVKEARARPREVS